MYRLEVVLFLLSMLPLIMACIFVSAVAPRRQESMDRSLRAAAHPAEETFKPLDVETTRSITDAAERVRKDFDSLYSYRLLLPALLLSTLYGLGFSLGISVLLPNTSHGILLWPFTAFGPEKTYLLQGPAFAVLGAYTFSTGVLVRRAFMADFNKNVMWSCINRLVISVGFSIFLHIVPSEHLPAYSMTRNALCFAIAFFPRVFITALRKRTRKSLGVGYNTQELDIQLIQGIDVWKEERLEEEGIESVQNMATADIFGLLPKVHYPLRTIINWIDQAIFIQRFPESYLRLHEAGFANSAMAFACIGDQANPDAALLDTISSVSGIQPPVLREALNDFATDARLRVLRRLWQTGAASD